MEVVFEKPKFRIRVFAFLFDFLCIAIATLFLMIPTRAIVQNTDFYSSANETITELEMASHLYVLRNDGTSQIMCDFYTPQTPEDYDVYNQKFDKALTDFYSDSSYFDQTDPNSGIHLYNLSKIPSGGSSLLFIFADETKTSIVEKSDADKAKLFDFYSEQMQYAANEYIVKTDAYLKAGKTITLSFVFIILLIPLAISNLIFEYMFPIIFKRGRKTLGKLLLGIGVVNSKGLSPSFLRFSCRFLLFFFLEILLSIPIFCIPLIISFSMFVFNKNNQSFHDYVSATYVVEGKLKSFCLNEKEYVVKKQNDDNFVLDSKNVKF